MKTSDSIGKIAPALLTAQKAITFAVKDATNPHFRSKYADLPAVIDAVKEPLNEAGIVFLQSLSPSESGSIAITTRLLHTSGEWMEDTAIIPLPKNDPQGYGSAASYGRRYSLASITGLYQDDDDGNAAMPAKKKTVITTPTAEIGDDLPDDIKSHLRDLAAYAVELINDNRIDEALDSINQENLDGDQKIWMAKQMPTKERNQLKAHSMSRARTPIPA